MFVSTGALPFPEKVSFTRHIAPLLERLRDHQWVNHGFAGFYGHQGLAPFVNPDTMAHLSSTDPGRRALRHQVFDALRAYDRDGESPVPWSWLYGDGMAIPPRTPLQHLALSPTQYRMFQYWADGNFVDDWGTVTPVRELGELPVAEQPAALDRAALDFCLADTFHPGCEVTWPIRHPSMFMAPFRIRHRPADRPEPPYGTVLTPETALSVNGPPMRIPPPPRPAGTPEQAALERVDLLEKASFRWRIDCLMASQKLADTCISARVERAATHAERWSDHAPVTAAFDLDQLQ
ncbi:hypothetical protein GCM10009760_36060 [Kitasatospora kazusensis]|uniref:L-lysine epsilon oxidase C-terminal domain-containing protein n=1 Tax=Kitasatospora kazusensis TaxID=407974 RepID=A0ABN2ZS51_9ACTN